MHQTDTIRCGTMIISDFPTVLTQLFGYILCAYVARVHVGCSDMVACGANTIWVGIAGHDLFEMGGLGFSDVADADAGADVVGVVVGVEEGVEV